MFGGCVEFAIGGFASLPFCLDLNRFDKSRPVGRDTGFGKGSTGSAKVLLARSCFSTEMTSESPMSGSDRAGGNVSLSSAILTRFFCNLALVGGVSAAGI